MRRWPPIVWPVMSVASLLILIGGSGQLRPPFLIAGGVLAAAVLVVSLYLAIRVHSGGESHRRARWALAGVALSYVALAAAAGVAGPSYAVAALAAGVIPLSAVALLVATGRSTLDEPD